MKSIGISATAMTMIMSGAARGETMPQLDFGNPMLISQVVWGAIIFALFYIAVSRIGLPGVGAILENRARTIEGDLAKARLAKDGADRSVADLTAGRRRAYADSQATLAAAVGRAKEEAALRAAAMNALHDRRLEESEARIGLARSAAMAELQGIATDITGVVVERLTGRAGDQAAVRSAIADELAARGLAR